ncbi:MAG: Si-specific NAD(P)(+) transhydrogenase, partial [Deltaproteobacteria bacterium]
SGPAGEKGAEQAATFAKRVAIIEAEAQPGGACLHTGTIPSKTLRESALYLSGVHSRGMYGVNYLVKRDISAQDLMYRRRHVVARELDRINRNFDRSRITHYIGRAELLDAHTVLVRSDHGNITLRAETLLVATGSRPHRPATMPFDLPQVYDSDTILGLQNIPRSLCIIGAGVIGSEYATMFAALGIRVVLLDGGTAYMSNLDQEIADQLLHEMMKLGVSVMLRQKVSKVEATENKNSLNITLGDGADFVVDAVLVAAGRQGNTQDMGLEKAGVQPTPRGHLVVNQHYQTAVPNIYAAGDVIGFPALASTSMEQGRTALCHAYDPTYRDRPAALLPFGIYTIPEVSCVGESEKSCQKKNIAYEVGRARYTDNARGEIIGDDAGMVKLIFDPDKLTLLGVHVIGERASELVHIGQTCMHFGGTLEFFVQAVFNYPTLSETYKVAAYDGMARLARARRTISPS